MFLQILSYKIRKSLKIQKSFLIDRKVHDFNIIIIQKQNHNINNMQSFNVTHNSFYLITNILFQSRTYIHVNKYLQLNQWIVKTAESNICLIRILICNTDNEMQTWQLINVYNSCLLFTSFIKRFLIILHLSELLKNDCKQLIIKDSNLHYSHWKKKKRLHLICNNQ